MHLMLRREVDKKLKFNVKVLGALNILDKLLCMFVNIFDHLRTNNMNWKIPLWMKNYNCGWNKIDNLIIYSVIVELILYRIGGSLFKGYMATCPARENILIVVCRNNNLKI